MAESSDVTDGDPLRLDGVSGEEARTLEHDDPQRRQQVQRMLETANLLDSRLRVPGTEFTFGLDGILGLIPGVGGSIGLGLSVVVILQAIVAGARPSTVLRMVGLAGTDALIGTVPVVGQLSDFVIKANNRNAKIAAAQLADPNKTTEDSRRTLITAVLVLCVALGALAWALVFLAVLILRWIF